MVRRLKNFYHFFSALLACLFFRLPSRKLQVVGVTGTDGKTTTTHLISHILQKAGFKVAVISSVGARLGREKVDTGFHVTTPDPWLLQRLLRKIVKKKFDYLVLEVTSHGLDQHRLLGINFKVGVLTNITHEHLDYHPTYKHYVQTKAKLFRKTKMAILNLEDTSYEKIRPLIPPKTKVFTYGFKKGDFNLGNFIIKTRLLGEYNLQNCLAAAAAAIALGTDRQVVKKAIADFKGVVGRLEEIDEGQDFKVFVDFAHTPNALENVLKTLSNLNPPAGGQTSNLTVVFGCDGLRDRAKRPLMGEIACRLAGTTVLTADNPRTEDLGKIIGAITEGCQKAGGVEGKTFFRVPDRREAIRLAVLQAKKGDIVAICGKGHERSMRIGEIEYPWSDQEEARKALKNLKKNA